MDVPTDTYDNFKAIVSYHAANTFYENIYTLVIDSTQLRLDSLEDKYKAKAKNYIDLVNEGRNTILNNLLNLHVKYIKIDYNLSSYVSLFTKYICGPATKIQEESIFCAKFLTKLYEKILVYIIKTGVNKITTIRDKKYFSDLQTVVKELFEETKKEINISSVSSDSKMDYIRSLEKRLNDVRSQYDGLNRKYEDLLAKYNNLLKSQNSSPTSNYSTDFEKLNPSFTNNTTDNSRQLIPQFYSSSSRKTEDEEYQAFVEQERNRTAKFQSPPAQHFSKIVEQQRDRTTNFQIPPTQQSSNIIEDEDVIDDFLSPDI